MRQLLRELVLGHSASATNNTWAALRKRQLLNPDDSLTEEGWVTAVELLSLNSQCAQLGIGLTKLGEISFQGRPELAALTYFESIGYVGAFCEGGPILLLIRSAALDVLTKLNPFGDREDARDRFTEAQLSIHSGRIQEICDEIRGSSTAGVQASFEEIYSSAEARTWYPGLSSRFMADLYTCIGAEGLATITAAIAERAYDYRNGWPDLTLMDGNGNLHWVEVKTNDKFHSSQIRTLRRMKEILPGTVSVVQLKRARKL